MSTKRLIKARSAENKTFSIIGREFSFSMIIYSLSVCLKIKEHFVPGEKGISIELVSHFGLAKTSRQVQCCAKRVSF